MVTVIALSAYALLMLVVASLSFSSSKTMSSFLVADRSQNKLIITISMLASTIGGGITIGTVNRASSMGFAAFWFVAAGAFAHFLQGALLSRKVRQSEALTMAELANKTSGPLARLLVSIIILITWTGISAAQFVALSSILSSLTGLSGNVSVAIGSLFIILYTLIGGQKTVLKTDFFQFGILAISIVIAVFWLWFGKTPAAAPQITLFTEKFGPLNLLYYIVVMGGSYFICPMMFSRILSTDTAENARKSSFLSGFGMLIFAFTLTFIGLWVKAAAFDSNGMDPLNAIARTALPGALGVALIFGLLSAILSTADTVLLTASSVMQNDIIKKPSVAMVRIWTVLIGGIAAFVALFERDIIGLLMKTYNGYTAGLVPSLFIALMYAKFEKGESKVKPCSLLFAIAIVGGYALGMAGSFAPEGPISMILPLAGMVFSATLALLAYSPRFRKN